MDAAKHLFFATKSHLVQNFAVNLAYVSPERGQVISS